MKEALIVINLVMSASFLVSVITLGTTQTFLIYLKIKREKRELELLSPPEEQEVLPIHDLLYAEEPD
jgi:hypothetical protein